MTTNNYLVNLDFGDNLSINNIYLVDTINNVANNVGCKPKLNKHM